MAVPYEACDLPSQRSEYKHPDTAIVLTLLSYYQVGLSKAALCDVVRGLGTLPDGKRNAKYKCAPLFDRTRFALPIVPSSMARSRCVVALLSRR